VRANFINELLDRHLVADLQQAHLFDAGSHHRTMKHT
jgi:hypothetical protein